ncbi:MAG: DUF1275 domain-containing protein [Williamsia herbipolensis]|nr:DUF1275 domain-containing protein [Williamsia herbipolensis]
MRVSDHLVASYLRHPTHGPLPAILLALTVTTGVVDAVSILGLGRVFVANMTGNVVFIGFALAGAPGFSLWGSVVALAAFLGGAMLGGRAVARWGGHRGRLIRDAVAVMVVVSIGALVAAPWVSVFAVSLVVLALLAVGLGVQNAVVRFLAVPDLTTTVLTMTLTGIGADLRKRDVATVVRRLSAVVAMLVGAAVGASLVLSAGLTAGLTTVLVLSVLTLVPAVVGARSTAVWTRSSRAG